MGRFYYTHFGDDVPKEIEKEYNRMKRQELYLEEKDKAHGVIHFDNDSLLYNVPDTSCNEKSDTEIKRENRLKYLTIALEKLKLECPDDYTLICEYYLNDKPVTMDYLSTKYGITIKALEYRLKKGKELLKECIIKCESEM